MARSVVLTAARVHAVIAAPHAEHRAAQALHDWIHSVDQQIRTIKSLRDEKDAVAADLLAKRQARKQSVAARHGFTIHRKTGNLVDVGKVHWPRTTDAQAIETMMKPPYVNLLDRERQGLGPGA